MIDNGGEVAHARSRGIGPAAIGSETCATHSIGADAKIADGGTVSCGLASGLATVG